MFGSIDLELLKADMRNDVRQPSSSQCYLLLCRSQTEVYAPASVI